MVPGRRKIEERTIFPARIPSSFPRVIRGAGISLPDLLLKLIRKRLQGKLSPVRKLLQIFSRIWMRIWSLQKPWGKRKQNR
jgi:hypothetical protein